MPSDQIGEFVSDYVEVRRDYRDWTPVHGQQHDHRKGDISETTSHTASTPPAGGDRHGEPDITHEQEQHQHHATANGVLGHMSEKSNQGAA